MPLYEYRCRECGDLTEVMQRISDPPLSTCDLCGGELKKLISAPAFQFKGSGWYVTDYAGKDGNDKDAKKENAAGSDGAKPDSAKSDDSGSASKDASAGGSAAAEPSAKKPAEPAASST